jgi:hypothetical protein
VTVKSSSTVSGTGRAETCSANSSAVMSSRGSPRR